MKMKDVSRELFLSVESRASYHRDETIGWGPCLGSFECYEGRYVGFVCFFVGIFFQVIMQLQKGFSKVIDMIYSFIHFFF